MRGSIVTLGMQGKKDYQEKLFASFQLSERIPKDNFYRRLKAVLDLDFLYPLTKGYYGESGQKSIDPVVFFKLCLVGYLENIISDRKLMEHCSMRLDILYLIGYDIDEELPWHSTISRTRQLFPEAVFEEVFTKVLALCVEKGMVSGHTQAIDSAPVKANASMDSLELKVPKEDLEAHLRNVRHLSAMAAAQESLEQARWFGYVELDLGDPAGFDSDRQAPVPLDAGQLLHHKGFFIRHDRSLSCRKG